MQSCLQQGGGVRLPCLLGLFVLLVYVALNCSNHTAGLNNATCDSCHVCMFVQVLMMTVLNLSFAACGFLGIYHLGAMEAFLRHGHGHKLLGSLGACAGASAGALVAAVMVTAPEKLEVWCTVQGYVGLVKPSGL